MSTIKQDFLSMKEANLKLNDFEKFLKKHESNMKVFCETKAKEFHQRKKALIDNLNEFIDDIINEAFDVNALQPAKQKVETFINTPGLQHLAENIFLNLKYRDLKSCALLNGSFQLLAWKIHYFC